MNIDYGLKGEGIIIILILLKKMSHSEENLYFRLSGDPKYRKRSGLRVPIHKRGVLYLHIIPEDEAKTDGFEFMVRSSIPKGDSESWYARLPFNPGETWCVKLLSFKEIPAIQVALGDISNVLQLFAAIFSVSTNINADELYSYQCCLADDSLQIRLPGDWKEQMTPF